MSAAVATPARNTNLRKAAIVLCALPDDLAAKVLEHLPAEEVDALTAAVAATQHVGRVEEQKVCTEYLNGLKRAGAPAGSERARALIQRAFDADEAARHLARLDDEHPHGPFDFIAEVGVGRVLPFLREEPPATLALVCACTAPAVAAEIVLALPIALQRDVLGRVAALGPVAAAAADAVGAGLERRIGTASPAVRGGVDAVRRICDAAGTAGAALLRAMEPDLPDVAPSTAASPLAAAPLLELWERAGQALRTKALSAVSPGLLARALRAAPPELGNTLLSALPDARRDAVRAEAAKLGPVKVSEAEQALEAVRQSLRQALLARRETRRTAAPTRRPAGGRA